MKFSKLNKLFIRSRIPKKIIIKAIYEYIGSKNGLRTVAWKNGLTHQTLWYWVKKFRLFRESLHRVVAERRGIPEIIVVDETEIKTTQGSMYLWFALDPYNKTLLGFSITKGRSNLECLLTFRYWFKCWYRVLSLVLSSQMQGYRGMVYGILSYVVSVSKSLLSKVVYTPILNVLMPPLRVIVGFILFSTALVLSVPSMALVIFLVSLLSLCSIIISFVLIRAWDILPLVSFCLGGGIKTRHYQKITDYSDIYSGSIINYEIILKHYRIPIGYEFISTISKTNMDTYVLFYITLTDLLDNSVNSSTFSYYSDGLTLNISLIPINSPLDLEGAHYIDVQANVTDRGGLLTVEVYNTFDEQNDWKILSMEYDPSTDLYTVSILVIISSGNLTYKVRAYDLAGFSSESNITIIEFSKALAPIIIVLDSPFSSPLVLEEKAIRIRANVTDDGNITNVQFSYKFTTEEEWMVETMRYDNETDCYFFDIELPKKSGTLIFKISATDDSSLTTETEIFEINYSVEKEVNPLTYIIPLAAVGSIGLITVVLLLLKKKGLIFR
ncbi:MAG: hypothetical protein K9W46_13080 [Candidatus Heimdallarchaeum endolithica]|uniref:Uncharacterized protein n=1 Tax=Candidatus Heimdallarchaeum endolithica TaxID=2876572 RepID=A0A9Y1BQU8_9ARCH|nr:MAG: hypothetical protein K9W46_13080 [Candidatus Heimdallarchaeum endolithica]